MLLASSSHRDHHLSKENPHRNITGLLWAADGAQRRGPPAQRGAAPGALRRPARRGEAGAAGAAAPMHHTQRLRPRRRAAPSLHPRRSGAPAPTRSRLPPTAARGHRPVLIGGSAASRGGPEKGRKDGGKRCVCVCCVCVCVCVCVRVCGKSGGKQGGQGRLGPLSNRLSSIRLARRRA